MKFAELASINVNDHIEKKNGLSYLSWAWAVDQLLRHDPMATWEYREPAMFGNTVMVFCTVTAFGKSMTAQLPVMNHRNQAIENPDAFQVNVAMQRCLAKAIALHGIGLYIYAGEDLPHDAEAEARAEAEAAQKALVAQATDKAKRLAAQIKACDSIEKLNVLAEVGPTIDGITPALLKRLADLVAERAEALA